MPITSARKPIIIGNTGIIEFEYIIYQDINAYLYLVSKELRIDSKLDKVLEPILKYESDNFPSLDFAQKEFHITFRQIKLKKGDYQNNCGWHLDKNKTGSYKTANRQYLFSSILPTEILLKEMRVEEDDEFNATVNLKTKKVIENNIVRNGKEIKMEGKLWTPKPFDIILVQNHLHRSPVATIDCERTFARLTVLETK